MSDLYIFETCREINNLLNKNAETEARNSLIKLLDHHETNEIEYSPLVNHLIRETGLYPYIDVNTSDWQERVIFDAFKVDIGSEEPVTLHREQSAILKKLIDGESLAISAPTSFGKSFVIDSFISVCRPKNVVIVVPTIALTDEIRRRIYPKFGREYKIITTSETELSEKNIFVFPQERAIGYADKLDIIDLLVVDEFYKASKDHDADRAPSLVRAILKLGEKAKQKYFLAPNVSSLKSNPFTRNMEFIKLDFNTVFLEKHELYKNIKGDESKKSEALLEILGDNKKKTLIYAGTHSQINNVANLIASEHKQQASKLLESFARWLTVNYDKNWILVHLVSRGTGIHTGQLHRSLSQIQVKLFEVENGLSNIISTSSIIEGVNTSAENVVIWRNRIGNAKLKDFTYRNIIGRGGRMFKHFIGQIYILEEPPPETENQLILEFPEEILGDINESKFGDDLTEEQINYISDYKKDMHALMGQRQYEALINNNSFQSSDSNLIKDIAIEMKYRPESWNGLNFLNSENADNWDSSLYKLLNLQPGNWDIKYSKFVEFVKAISRNWTHSIPELLSELDELDITIEQFFNLERNVTFKLSALVSDVNVLHNQLIPDSSLDLSKFIFNISHAFLPSSVYQLEEFGLPRMISKKIHQAGLIDFTDLAMTLDKAIERLNSLGLVRILVEVKELSDFDHYLLKHFYEGIDIDR